MNNEGIDGRRVEARGGGGQVEQNRCVGLEGPALASCGIRRRRESIMSGLWRLRIQFVWFLDGQSHKSQRRWKVPHYRS